MADNLLYAEPASATKSIATKDFGGIHYQKFLLADPTTPTQMQTVNADGTAEVMARRDLKTITVTPVVSLVAYTAGDAVGGSLQFPNAVRFSGGSCQIRSLMVISKSVITVPIELVLFDRAFTHPGDNAPWNPSDADAANIVAVIRMATVEDLRLVTAVWTNNVPAGLPGGATGSFNFEPHVSSNGTDLFGALVINATPTLLSASDVIVKLGVERLT